ncbi:MAG: hypothetical protein JSV11_10920 [Nitrospiraceae bacterium]|nr:MAG: hypothetical protein JSV11_10920 [Nitrospiraceae bacterium]
MIKRTFIALALSLFLFQGTALAVETQGEVIFRDALYGAAIGAILGSALYLADDEDFSEKLAIGVVVGTIGGVAYGFYETRAFVELENDTVKLAMPTPMIKKKRNGFLYYASLLKTRF